MLLPKIAAVGIYNSSIAAKNTDISKNRKTSMFEIELPMEEGGISYIDSASTPITPGMVICAKPGQTRHTKFPYKCFYIHMIVHDGTLYDTLMDIPDFFETDKSDTYREMFRELTEHYGTLSDSEEIIIQSLVLKIIYTISRDSAKTVKSSSSAGNQTIIERSFGYIKDHLTEDLSLETVARSVSLSPIHFHNTFKAAVGMTLRDYVEEQRIRKAINLLLTTNYSLTKIAFECGFSSQSYFSYVFKRRMKVTPREYVREINSKYEI